MTTATLHWEFRNHIKDFRDDGRLALLISLMLHSNIRGRCWPGMDKLAEKTGWSLPALTRAKQYLLDVGAITLVPYAKRVDEELKLPARQHVYQITGIMGIGAMFVPYLFMNPEAQREISEVVKAIREFKVNTSKTSLSKTLLVLTKDSTSIEDGSSIKDSSSEKSGPDSSESISPSLSLGGGDGIELTKPDPAPATEAAHPEPALNPEKQNTDTRKDAHSVREGIEDPKPPVPGRPLSPSRAKSAAEPKAPREPTPAAALLDAWIEGVGGALPVGFTYKPYMRFMTALVNEGVQPNVISTAGKLLASWSSANDNAPIPWEVGAVTTAVRITVALCRRGVTAEMVRNFVCDKKADPFWRGKIVTFKYLNDNIVASLSPSTDQDYVLLPNGHEVDPIQARAWYGRNPEYPNPFAVVRNG